ncbi:MAG TPA: YkgJ family cysteine cluster protein [Clostridiales bacterium UBA8960]|jgi:Fe-S-cluster containining protein|nr:YkgJ family cysteine cluster protein [Clostridiales bacterium UBA8960]
MNQKINLHDISDGRLYDIDDLVRADTNGCGGCSACCYGVGGFVELNPYDVFKMTTATQMSFDDLLLEKLELCLKGKRHFPYLRMLGAQACCSFLSQEGRCTIHASRPSICRLFPLGRVYDNQGDFKFILQTNACIKPKLDKIKVEKWIGIDHYAANKAFILAWHNFNKALEFRMKFMRDTEEVGSTNQYVLDVFFHIEAKSDFDFYDAFFKKLPSAKNHLGIL